MSCWPFCALLTALLGLVAAYFTGKSYYVISYPLTTAAVLIVALNMGPSLGRWGLVGHHRIVPRSGNDPQRIPGCNMTPKERFPSAPIAN